MLLSSRSWSFPYPIGEDRHAVALVHWIAVGLPIYYDPTQIQVQVVVPGHPDPAVHLDAILDQLGASLGDVGLGDADDLTGVGGAVLDRPGGVDGDGLGGLEPQFHVGEAVLEGLIGRQCATERRTVESVLDGEVEDPVGRAHDLRALQYQDR